MATHLWRPKAQRRQVRARLRPSKNFFHLGLKLWTRSKSWKSAHQDCQGCIWSEHTYTSYRASADRCGHGLGFKIFFKNFQKNFHLGKNFLKKFLKAQAVPAPGAHVSLGFTGVLPAHNKGTGIAGAKATFFAEMENF